MNIGKACAIFEQIQEEKYSDQEKLWAIKDVLDMPTHNGITKDTILNTFKWFFDYAIEEAQEESTEPEVQTRWIPVTERLPKEYVPVNVTWKNRNPESYYSDIKDVPFTATAVYCNGKWYWYSSTCVDYLKEYGKCDWDLVDEDIDIIAWMPLPEPWKGE